MRHHCLRSQRLSGCVTDKTLLSPSELEKHTQGVKERAKHKLLEAAREEAEHTSLDRDLVDLEQQNCNGLSEASHKKKKKKKEKTTHEQDNNELAPNDLSAAQEAAGLVEVSTESQPEAGDFEPDRTGNKRSKKKKKKDGASL